jgi:sugar/nucleoside kinase (ribokinase family)
VLKKQMPPQDLGWVSTWKSKPGRGSGMLFEVPLRRKIDVVTLGTLNIDIIIIGDAPRSISELNQWVAPSQVEITTAGSVGYTAIDLARLGIKVSLLSSLADDELGGFVLANLKKQGIDTEAVALEKGRSSGIGIYMLLFGDRKRPLTGRLATHAPWPKKFSSLAQQKLKNARLLHCGGYLHYPDRWGKPTEEIFKLAKLHGLVTCLDPQFPFGPAEKPWIKHFGDLLKYVDIIFTDELEAAEITGEADLESAAQRLLFEGPRLVVVKQGAKGAMLMSGDEVIHQPAVKVREITDSIGTGDAFDAGVIHAVLNGLKLKETAKFASAVAALTLKGMGGTQTAPTLEQARAFLKKTK